MSPILAASSWRTNGDLMVDVAKLYIGPDDVVGDVTYGRGKWWTKYRPAALVIHDLRIDGVNFCDLPEADDFFDVVAYDPPYIAQGGRETSTLDEFMDRYGLFDAPKTPLALQGLINDGLAEIHRVLKPGGRVLVKCKDYVSGAKLWPATYHTVAEALRLGYRLEDRFEHVGRPGRQPKRKRQYHARRNLSTLLVFTKPKRGLYNVASRAA